MKTKTTTKRLARKLANQRKRPLLILYWPDEGSMRDDDVPVLRRFLKGHGLSRKSKMPRLDVLIETLGGDTDAPYLMGQLLHDYAKKILFLVPNKSISAGTEMCLAGHMVLMGEDATLSPIDAQIPDENGKYLSETAIRNFLELANQSENGKVGAAIIKHTIGKISPHQIAQLYRESSVMGKHAEQLLEQYMLNECDSGQIRQTLNNLTIEAPSHDWAIDYHVAKEIGLQVGRMQEEISDTAKAICKQISKEIAAGARGDGKSGMSPYFLYTALPNAR